MLSKVQGQWNLVCVISQNGGCLWLLRSCLLFGSLVSSEMCANCIFMWGVLAFILMQNNDCKSCSLIPWWLLFHIIHCEEMILMTIYGKLYFLHFYITLQDTFFIYFWLFLYFVVYRFDLMPFLIQLSYFFRFGMALRAHWLFSS